MRLFLSLIAVAMFVVAVGCDKPTPSASNTGAGSGSGSAAAPNAAPAELAMGDVSADTSSMQEVSLKLPGMT